MKSTVSRETGLAFYSKFAAISAMIANSYLDGRQLPLITSEDFDQGFEYAGQVNTD